jgi:hypothetical protein
VSDLARMMPIPMEGPHQTCVLSGLAYTAEGVGGWQRTVSRLYLNLSHTGFGLGFNERTTSSVRVQWSVSVQLGRVCR